MPNFADCVTRISEGTGRYMREYRNPSKEVIQNVLSRKCFPGYPEPPKAPGVDFIPHRLDPIITPEPHTLKPSENDPILHRLDPIITELMPTGWNHEGYIDLYV